MTPESRDVDGRSSRGTGDARPKVVIVAPRVPHYRRRFYELLRDRLDEEGIDFVLVYGHSVGEHVGKMDDVDVPWGLYVPARSISVRDKELLWQPAFGAVRDADLVIVMQAARYLPTYVHLLRQALGGPRFAFWGHGKNFQGARAWAAAEGIKRTLSRMVHWWFAYNHLSAQVVIGLGVPGDRVTVVQNSIDTRALARAAERTSSRELERLRRSMALKGDHVGLFCGSLYPEKRLDLLVSAAERIRSRVPDFELIVLGAGRDSSIVERAAARYEWIHYVGPRFDDDRVPYFLISDVFLLPGLAGLAVLDSFALELPMAVSASGQHSPEIDYVKDGHNGLIVDDGGDPDRYAEHVVDLLSDDQLRSRIREGCAASRTEYTIENMAERFAGGVMEALRR